MYFQVGPSEKIRKARVVNGLATVSVPVGDRKVVEDPEYSSETDSESVVEGVSPVSRGIS